MIQPSLFTLQQKLEISIEIAEGLISLHTGNVKITHNDIKPANILLDYQDTEDGSIIFKRLAITDFGNSKYARSEKD